MTNIIDSGNTYCSALIEGQTEQLPPWNIGFCFKENVGRSMITTAFAVAVEAGPGFDFTETWCSTEKLAGPVAPVGATQTTYRSRKSACTFSGHLHRGVRL